jgi:hypothetical protein
LNAANRRFASSRKIGVVDSPRSRTQRVDPVRDDPRWLIEQILFQR